MSAPHDQHGRAVHRRDPPAGKGDPNLLEHRLVGALHAKIPEKWLTGPRYLKMDEFLEWQVDQQVSELDSEERPESAAVVA